MEKELISGFVDNELEEIELHQLKSENRNEVKKLVTTYRVIGKFIRDYQSPIQATEQFQHRLKQALQQEYSISALPEREEKICSCEVGISRMEPVKEKSVA